MRGKEMSDFKKFVIALKKYLEEIGYKGVYERSKSYESFYESIKDLDCHDFRFFFFKAHYLYAIMDNIEEAKDYIEKSINSIALIKHVIDSPNDLFCDNTPFLFVPIEGKGKYIPLKLPTLFEIISHIYTIAGEICSNLDLDAEALKYYQRANYYKLFLKTEIENRNYVYLYSFRRFNEYSLSDLINNEISVSPSKNMNDPFDSIINLWGSEEQLKETCKEHKHIKNLSRSFDYFRIRSFCNGETEEALGNLLMWSHYADEHRGYCVKYKLSKHYIKQDENDSFEHMFLKPIIYRKDEEKVDISGMTSINTDLAFATKHESWKYEKEVRLIVYNPNKEESFYGIPLDKDSCIEAIYFGCKCEPETINTIKNLFSKADIPPKFFKVYSESKDVYQLKWDKSV